MEDQELNEVMSYILSLLRVKPMMTTKEISEAIIDYDKECKDRSRARVNVALLSLEEKGMVSRLILKDRKEIEWHLQKAEV